MPIVGFNITSINAKNNEKPVTGEIGINSTPKIISVEKKDLGVVKDAVAVRFSFGIVYEPKVGEINYTGEILYQSVDSKKILKKWKDEKKLDDDIAVEILNSIFRRCLARATLMSEELRLPPPIRFPVVHPQDQGK